MVKNNLTTQPNPKLLPNLTSETIGQLVENQARELELRAQELALQKQQDDHGFEFSKKALDAQLEDRKTQRDHHKHMQHSLYFFVGFLSIMVVAIVITSLWLNKDVIAIEIIKAIGYMLAGGFGGYGVSKNKVKQQSSETDTKSSV